MTTEKDSPLRELGWFPQKYTEALARYRIRTIREFYGRYLGSHGRASMASVFGLEGKDIQTIFDPLIKQVETYLGPEYVRRVKDFVPPHRAMGALPPWMKGIKEDETPLFTDETHESARALFLENAFAIPIDSFPDGPEKSGQILSDVIEVEDDMKNRIIRGVHNAGYRITKRDNEIHALLKGGEIVRRYMWEPKAL